MVNLWKNKVYRIRTGMAWLYCVRYVDAGGCSSYWRCGQSFSKLRSCTVNASETWKHDYSALVRRFSLETSHRCNVIGGHVVQI